uniref:lipid droplet-associated hydrolase isoform X1 n=1 Tax=Myxine glutinosa TaxID=7769 RepID=UPI00358F27B9
MSSQATEKTDSRSLQPGPVPICEFIFCNGAATELIKFGCIELRHAVPSALSTLFLIIPGNPGVVQYYRPFLTALYQAFKGRYPVWAIGHAGHCDPPRGMPMSDGPKKDHDIFGLEGQIDHKIAFLHEQVDPSVRVVLIGHSIGCYVILEMMKREPRLKVAKAVLLFPTIERMSTSPQGRYLSPVLCNLRYLLYPSIAILSLLPKHLKSMLTYWAFRCFSLGGVPDSNFVKASLSLFNVHCVANGMFMASQEMTTVLQRDDETIKKHLHKLLFYYGTNDLWCPKTYYDDLHRDYPCGDIRLCTKGMKHAFVLDASVEMAWLVHGWMEHIVSQTQGVEEKKLVLKAAVHCNKRDINTVCTGKGEDGE